MNARKAPIPVTIRAPIPWRDSYQQSFDFCSENLFVTSQSIRDLQNLWHSEFSEQLFFNLEGKAAKPMVPQDFIQFVSDQADAARDRLVQDWIPKCAQIIQKNFFEARDNFAKGSHI